MHANVSFKSYIKHYWIVWLIIVLILILSEVFSINERNNFDIYALLVWLPIMIINVIEQRRLLRYVEQNHSFPWKQIKSKEGEIRAYLHLYFTNNIAFDDPEVVVLKDNYKSFVKFVFVVFFSLPILSIITYFT